MKRMQHTRTTTASTAGDAEERNLFLNEKLLQTEKWGKSHLNHTT